MSGNQSAGDPAKTHLAENATLIGQMVIEEDEANTVPDGFALECKTFISESTADQLPSTKLPTASETAIGKYQIKEVLGKGGMGVVYKAFDPLIEREVALKVLSSEIARTPAALQRFLCEARSIGRLNHAHVVSIYEINEWNGIYYLVMELLTGGSVADLAERSGVIPWRDACRIVAQAARGLAAAHSAGMIHRDIKPANLMLTASGDVKVVDFGLSKLLDSDSSLASAVTRAGQLLGTPQYMSPEQFDGVAVDARTDIYALGATLYRLLTDQFPYHDCTTIVQLMKAHVFKPVPRASLHSSGIPAACDHIISKAMAKDPDDRYASCTEMAADLEALIAKPAFPVSSESVMAPLNHNGIAERVISSAMIIEPSRLQAAMRQDLLMQAGAAKVEVGGSIAEAGSMLEQNVPDVIWTAMELPDGRGLNWLRSIGAKGSLRYTTVVLNSSDCTVAELTSVGKTGSLIFAPKTARLESIIRMIHAAGPVRLSRTAMTAPVDPSSAPIRLISDTGRTPDRLTSLLAELQLTDLEVLSPSKSTSHRTSPPLLTLLVRTSDNRPGDETVYSAMVTLRRSEMAAALQAVDGKLLLRAIGHGGVIALMNRPLDSASLRALLQAGR